jgi:hypothetical protein
MSKLADKVKIMRELWEITPEDHEEVTPGARSFLARSMKSVLGCLSHHFDNNVQQFCDHWALLYKAKFSQHCCGGKKDITCGKNSSI